MFGFGSQLWPRRKRKTRKYFLSACIIVKDEARYILELIAYHRVVGFNFFYIYDNDSTDGLGSLLSPLVQCGVCRLIEWPRSKFPQNPQYNAYYHMIRHYGHETEWLATIDADEFVVPITMESVASILRQHFENRESVVCNWRVFGSSAQVEPDGRLCMERFQYASESDFSVNNNMKSIFRPEAIEYALIHNHYMKNDNVATSDGASFSTPRAQTTDRPVYGHLQVNHYFCKSRAEFAEKRLKGLADHPLTGPLAIRSMQAFDLHDRNDVAERRIIRFLDRTKSEIERLQQLKS